MFLMIVVFITVFLVSIVLFTLFAGKATRKIADKAAGEDPDPPTPQEAEAAAKVEKHVREGSPSEGPISLDNLQPTREPEESR